MLLLINSGLLTYIYLKNWSATTRQSHKITFKELYFAHRFRWAGKIPIKALFVFFVNSIFEVFQLRKTRRSESPKQAGQVPCIANLAIRSIRYLSIKRRDIRGIQGSLRRNPTRPRIGPAIPPGRALRIPPGHPCGGSTGTCHYLLKNRRLAARFWNTPETITFSKSFKLVFHFLSFFRTKPLNKNLKASSTFPASFDTLVWSSPWCIWCCWLSAS